MRQAGAETARTGDAPAPEARAAEALRRALDHCAADRRLAPLVAGAGTQGPIGVTEAEIAGRRVRFATDRRRDPIQRRHRGGAFFEPEELELLRGHLPPGGTFVDIGANVGNHSLFAGLFLDAGRIIPFEPNPPAIRLLVLNLVMNGIAPRVRFDFVGYGAADLDAEGFAMTGRDRNLGAARMVAGAGAIATLRPDDVLRDERPEVVKIDVEGMEMAVLRGLQKTVARCRPVLLVECDRANLRDFGDWRLAHRYEVAAVFRHYAANRNFLLVPGERAA